jgi:hypothetical protein
MVAPNRDFACGKAALLEKNIIKLVIIGGCKKS